MTTPEDEAFEAQQAEAGWLAEWAEMSAEERAEYERALDDYEDENRHARREALPEERDKMFRDYDPEAQRDLEMFDAEFPDGYGGAMASAPLAGPSNEALAEEAWTLHETTRRLAFALHRDRETDNLTAHGMRFYLVSELAALRYERRMGHFDFPTYTRYAATVRARNGSRERGDDYPRGRSVRGAAGRSRLAGRMGRDERRGARGV